ncbi:hypothetical protein L4C54_19685 [Vibrio lamellibrachiae]|uniref:hypothetical protein n=1 Tax=Vibrio lamellibrachiae TaxID=2910253 RepID=UPI003D0C0644
MGRTLTFPRGDTGFLPNIFNLAAILHKPISARRIAKFLSVAANIPLTLSDSTLDKMMTTGVGKESWKRFETLLIKSVSSKNRATRTIGPQSPIGSHDSHITWTLILNEFREFLPPDHSSIYVLNYLDKRCHIHAKSMLRPQANGVQRLEVVRFYLGYTGLTEQERKEVYLDFKAKLTQYNSGVSIEDINARKGIAIERFELDFYLGFLSSLEETLGRVVLQEIMNQKKDTYWQCFLNYVLIHSIAQGSVTKMAKVVPITGLYQDTEHRKEAQKNKLNKWRNGKDLPSNKVLGIFLTKLKVRDLLIYAHSCRYLDKLRDCGKWTYWDDIVTSDNICRYRNYLQQA